jgi:hypothetical protein
MTGSFKGSIQVGEFLDHLSNSGSEGLLCGVSISTLNILNGAVYWYG